MKLNEKITIFIGIALVGTFVIGLAWSISTGLAGFYRGIPFWIIVIFCLSLLIYDSLKSVKKKNNKRQKINKIYEIKRKIYNFFWYSTCRYICNRSSVEYKYRISWILERSSFLDYSNILSLSAYSGFIEIN